MNMAHARPMPIRKKRRPRAQLFSDAQKKILIDTVRKAEARFRREGLTQEELAKALDLTQPSVSRLKKGLWTPGLTTARYIAQLEGVTLEDLIGPVRLDDEPMAAAPGATLVLDARFQNLEICVRFHADEKRWSPWTLAAARAGFFGEKDFAPTQWPPKLDALEAALSHVKR